MSPASQPSPSRPTGEQVPDALQPPVEEAGLSLDQLGQAFAALLGEGHDPYSTAAETDSLPTTDAASSPEGSLAVVDARTPGAPFGQPRPSDLDGLPPPDVDRPPSPDSSDASCEISPRTILEAMLFVGRPDNQPITSQQIAGLMRGVTAEEVDDLVGELNADYSANGCPYLIASEGPGYRLNLREAMGPLRDRFYGRVRAAKLSPAAIEVLALVAYNEPLTSEEVSKLRGKPSGHILAQMVRRQLLRIERSTTKPIQTKYLTTQRFLDVFHLRSREDLPRSEDLDRA